MISEDKLIEKVVKHLESSLIEDLKDYIQIKLREMVKIEFEAIHKRFDRIEKTIDFWKNDLDEDKDNLRGLRTNTAHINTELKEIGNSVDKLPKKLENSVKDTVESTVKETASAAIPKAVHDTFDIVSRKVQVIKKPTRGLFNRFKFWG